MKKSELRNKYLEIRDNILPTAEDGQNLRNNFLKHTNNPTNIIVGTYQPHKSEIDVSYLNKALYYSGCKLALPRIDGDKINFHEWSINTKLIANKFGIEEPNPECAILKPDIIIVPLVAFNLNKFRIGYGGGYYDKYLAQFTGEKIGVAYNAQYTEHEFQQEHDIKLDLIVTENRIHF